MNKLTINPNRIELDEAYMQMAEIWAKRSKANRKQVGALIIKDRQIISDGYNGLPAGDADDVCEYFTNDTNSEQGLSTKPEVLHAESNAIAKIAENGGVGAQGATLYVTMSPCFECAKMIKQAKIARVVFREIYRDTTGIKFLRDRGVQLEQLNARDSVPAPEPIKFPEVDEFAALRQVRDESIVPRVTQSASELLKQIHAEIDSDKPLPTLEDAPQPKLPEPAVLPVSDAELEAMIAQATAASVPQKKSLLSAVANDDGVYRSPYQ